MRILLTGATGFVGRGVLQHLQRRDSIEVRKTSRSLHKDEEIEGSFAVDLCSTSAVSHLVEAIDVVIHTAAKVHVMEDVVDSTSNQYWEVNVNGTLNLARHAANAGVKRFIFVSSIKVNGEQTKRGRHFVAADSPAPIDAYAVSKNEAEYGLRYIAEQTGMEVTIIRPPLVYGPGVKGNFGRLVKLVKSGVPLPLGAVDNCRSMIALENLADLIVTCVDHPYAANQTFLASDDDDLSTTQLLQDLAKVMNKPSRLVPVPIWCLKLCLKLLGKEAIAERLLCSLKIDITKTKEILGWTPPISTEEGLRRCFAARGF